MLSRPVLNLEMWKMSEELYQESLLLLRSALSDSRAFFHPGQWEAIEAPVRRRARMLIPCFPSLFR